MRALVLFGVIAFFVPSVHAEDAQHEFVGVQKCALCHKKPEQGEQFKIWSESKHAKAFETLGTQAAKDIGKKMGIDDPQKSGKCLKCHSTAYGNTENKVTEAVPVEEGISCESCHGAGKDFMKKSVMEDKDAAKEAGLVIPNETTCKKCHNEESPNFKPFNFKESYEKIKHEIPKEK